MREKNIKSGIVITSAVHMPRSMEVFKDSNLFFIQLLVILLHIIEKQNFFAYIPQFKVLKDLYSAFWEYIGLVYYKIRY